MIRLLHTADLHLDSPLKSLALKDERLSDRVKIASRDVLRRLVQTAIDKDVSAVLIAGDLFDGKERSAQTAAFLIGQLACLRDAGIAVFYLKGNHDAENPASGTFELPDNVHTFGGRGGKIRLDGSDIWIHGVSFSGQRAPESLLPKYDAPVADAVNIGMLHTSLGGAEGHDVYAPCSVADLVGHGFDYWALGHIHKREVHSASPWIVMPGIPQGRDIGEAGPKSATLVTIDGNAIDVEEVPTSSVEFRRSRCDISGVEDDDELRDRLSEHLHAEADGTISEAAILRLELAGETERAWQIRRDIDVWNETIARLAEGTGQTWIEKTAFNVTPPSVAFSGPQVDALAEIQTIMDEIRTTDSFREEARKMIDDLLQVLPAERRRMLAPDQPAVTDMLEDMTNRAALSMVARMKGPTS